MASCIGEIASAGVCNKLKIKLVQASIKVLALCSLATEPENFLITPSVGVDLLHLDVEVMGIEPHE
jgi:hypothetical protein